MSADRKVSDPLSKVHGQILDHLIVKYGPAAVHLAIDLRRHLFGARAWILGGPNPPRASKRPANPGRPTKDAVKAAMVAYAKERGGKPYFKEYESVAKRLDATDRIIAEAYAELPNNIRRFRGGKKG
jgi:hypothetical protein